MVKNSGIHIQQQNLHSNKNIAIQSKLWSESKERRKGKYEAAEKFVERMKKIQEEAKAALGKA